MEDNNFEVFYQQGLKPGVSQEEASAKLAAIFKVSPEQAEKMILATNRIVKKGLTREQAERYYAVLDEVGMRVEIHENAPQTALHEPQTAIQEPDKVEPVNTPVADPDSVLADSQRVVQVQFNGRGFEYFKIWIVNIFLTIVTLGIYSAWAKVRNKQYFYGNTVIDESSFNYTANPIAILKGRLIALALFIVYALVNQFVPLLGFILFLVLLTFLPWIIIRSLAFNARNSVYRNIRFNFTGKVGDAVKAFLLWPILMLPTLGFILPLVWYKQSRFFINNSSYGTTPFTLNATVKDYYRIFFILLGGLLLVGLVMAGLVAAVGINPNNPGVMMAAMFPFSLLIYLVMFGYLAAALGNLYYNSTTLAGHGFNSSLQTRNVAWIYFTNTLAIMFSLGLLIPWAQVRMARYRADCLQLNVRDSLDDFIAAEQQAVSALGEQIGEVFDMDVSIV